VTENQRYRVYLCVLAVLLYFPALGSRDFWAPVEPRYAQIARVMFAKGEWLVPTLNGELYTDKPILYFWLVLIASKIVGAVNEWTVRLPSAMAGIGFVLAAYAIGRDFFSARVGFIAGAVLATSIRVFWEARWAHVDMLFSFFFTLTMYFAARSLLGKGKPAEVLYAYLFLGLATLSKGLIGVVLPGLIFVAFMVARRDWRLLAGARLGPGIAIFLLVVAPWFLLVNGATEGKWLNDFIYVHHLQRYIAGSGHRQPFYYYFQTLPVDFLPWTVFLLPALLTYRSYRNLSREPVTILFVLWFFVIFLFFSLSDTKRDLYLLPALPPLGFFIAKYIDGLIQNRLPQSTLFRALTSIFFHLLWAGALAVPVFAWLFRRDAVWIGIPSALAMAAGGLAGVYFIQRREPERLFRATVLMMVLTAVTGSLLIIPHVDQYKSSRSLSHELKEKVPPEVPLYIYADTTNDFNYYTEREIIPIIESESQVEKLRSQHSASYMLVKERDLKRLAAIPVDRIVATKEVGSTTWNLVFLGGQAWPRSP
jgi:4-amino-4-deoxy-L-arabinose transferase-like glycosyltransferase